VDTKPAIVASPAAVSSEEETRKGKGAQNKKADSVSVTLQLEPVYQAEQEFAFLYFPVCEAATKMEVRAGAQALLLLLLLAGDVETNPGPPKRGLDKDFRVCRLLAFLLPGQEVGRRRRS
jgi:hypothetical protein